MAHISPALRAATIRETVEAGGRAFRLVRPRSPDDLIDQAEYERDERLPYWADLWASGRVLADVLGGLALRGRTLVELGCGLALPSLVAAAGGARALATDWYPDALDFVRHNAAQAGLPVETLLVDWRDPPARVLGLAPFDLVVAADVLYEARNAEALSALLPRLVAPSTRVLIADPRRPDARLLLAPLAAAGWSHRREDLPVSGRVDEAGPVVHLHHLRPPPAGA